MNKQPMDRIIGFLAFIAVAIAAALASPAFGRGAGDAGVGSAEPSLRDGQRGAQGTEAAAR